MDKRQAKIEALIIAENAIERALNDGAGYGDSSDEDARKIDLELELIAQGFRKRIRRLSGREL